MWHLLWLLNLCKCFYAPSQTSGPNHSPSSVVVLRSPPPQARASRQIRAQPQWTLTVGMGGNSRVSPLSPPPPSYHPALLSLFLLLSVSAIPFPFGFVVLRCIAAGRSKLCFGCVSVVLSQQEVDWRRSGFPFSFPFWFSTRATMVSFVLLREK